MARPTTPLIDRNAAVATALDLIDREGLESFSIRKLAAELGVNGASLYHHFADKEAILDGVRMAVWRDARVGADPGVDEPWSEYLRRTAIGYREMLLRHPNVAPLMAPTILLRPYSVRSRDLVATKLLAQGVAPALIVPIIDSVETLAFASALLNPHGSPPADRLTIHEDDHVPGLTRAVRAAPKRADRVFAMQLDALIDGWRARVAGCSE